MIACVSRLFGWRSQWSVNFVELNSHQQQQQKNNNDVDNDENDNETHIKSKEKKRKHRKKFAICKSKSFRFQFFSSSIVSFRVFYLFSSFFLRWHFCFSFLNYSSCFLFVLCLRKINSACMHRKRSKSKNDNWFELIFGSFLELIFLPATCSWSTREKTVYIFIVAFVECEIIGIIDLYSVVRPWNK